MSIFTARADVIWTIPNILTIGRLIATPFVVLVYGMVERPTADWIALTIFAVGALTDFVDGYLARKLNQFSEFGKMLDPIADKAMVTCALFALAFSYGPYLSFLIPASLILLRETLIAGLREYAAGKSVNLAVTRLAKWKTTAQMTAISVLLFHAAWIGPQMSRPDYFGVFMVLALGLLWVAAALTVVTGWDYLRKTALWMMAQEKGKRL